MSSISFNPFRRVSDSVPEDRTQQTQQTKQDNKTSGSGWSSEAGSVSFSEDRYAKADAYSRTGQAVNNGAAASGKVKPGWKSPIPAVTKSDEYGSVVGEPKLSEKAAEYYKQLKSKYGNLDFILVDKNSLQAAKANANSYGNANHLVVLIDEEKLERMATDENYRKKYETMISQAASGGSRLSQLAAQNPGIMKVGMNTSDDGKGSFVAACLKNAPNPGERIAEKRAEKKAEAKAAEKKAHKKHEENSRLERREARRTEEDELREKIAEKRNRTVLSEDDFSEYKDNDDYELIYADSMEELITKLEAYNERMGYGTPAVQGAGQYMDYQA